MKSHDTAICNEVKDYGLKMISVPRKNGGHGGLGVIYTSDIKLKLSSKQSRYKTFEYFECVMKSNEGLIRFCNIYRRPYSQIHRFTVSQFICEFENYLETLINKSGIPILLGDFNLHLEDISNPNVPLFLNLVNEFSLEQKVPTNMPTHDDGGLLDIVLSSEMLSTKISHVCVYPHGTSSDHFMVSFDLKCNPEVTAEETSKWYRDFRTIDDDNFRCDIKSCVNINAILEFHDTPDNVNIASTIYHDELKKLLDKHCPLKQKTRISGKRYRDSWFDKNLYNLLRECRTAERKWRKSKCLNDKMSYKSLQKLYETTVKSKRRISHSNSLFKVKNDKRKLYRKLNELLGKENQVLPQSTDNKALVQDFSHFFESKITKIRSEIEHERDAFCPPPVCNHCKYDGDQLTGFKTLTAEDFNKLLSSMSQKFCVLDPIPTWLLLDCIDELSPILLKIINLSLKFGVFPTNAKTAVIKPTVKDVNSCTDAFPNYRPVSNIPFISKLIEKAVLNQLNEHLLTNDLICSNQSGYRRYHSCETLNIKLFDAILKDIDEGSTVALLLLDMSAAFDTVDHPLLLSLLQECYGLDDVVLEWFKSYLENRTCAVNISDAFSNFVCLLFGVPQGSILGPILFTLYTKHVQHIALKYNLQVQLYADDTQLYIGFKCLNHMSVQTVKANIENCIIEIKCWMCFRYLKLNEGKTKLLLLAKPSVDSVNPENCLTLDVCSNEIDCFDWSDDVKSLGVYLDPHCKLEKHIAQIRKSCIGKLMSWKRIAIYMTEDVKIMLVKQIILSKLDYSNSLYAGLPNIMINKLQTVINSAIRFIYNIKYNDSITPYIIKSHILPESYRIDFKICVIVFNCLHGLAPNYLKDIISWNTPRSVILDNESSVPPRRTQDPLLLVIPTDFGCRTSYRSRTFSHYAPRCWNQLPYQIRNIKNKDTFKKDLKTYFFGKFLLDI